MKYSIFTDIDTILDTRLLVALTIDFDKAMSELESGKYHERIRDQIAKIPYELFRAFYDKRNKLILQHAAPCKIIGIIRDYFLEAMSDVKTSVEPDTKYLLYLNIHPYDLLEEEIDNLKKYVSLFIPGVDINIVNFSLKEIKPEWVSDNIQTMVMYDGLYWCEYFMATKELINHPVLNCAMLAPAVITQSTYESTITNKHFSELQDYLKSVIDLNLIPSMYFSGVITEDINDKEIKETENTDS